MQFIIQATNIVFLFQSQVAQVCQSPSFGNKTKFPNSISSISLFSRKDFERGHQNTKPCFLLTFLIVIDRRQESNLQSPDPKSGALSIRPHGHQQVFLRINVRETGFSILVACLKVLPQSNRNTGSDTGTHSFLSNCT